MYDKMYWPTLKKIRDLSKKTIFSNFEPIQNGPYNLFDQDLFPGMTKNVLLTFIYIHTHIRKLPLQTYKNTNKKQTKKCFAQFKTIYCFM